MKPREWTHTHNTATHICTNTTHIHHTMYMHTMCMDPHTNTHKTQTHIYHLCTNTTHHNTTCKYHINVHAYTHVHAHIHRQITYTMYTYMDTLMHIHTHINIPQNIILYTNAHILHPCTHTSTQIHTYYNHAHTFTQTTHT